jgi:hypothetical protein
MGGKGSSGSNDRMRFSSPATGDGGGGGQQNLQRPRQQPQTQQMPQQRQQRPQSARDMGLRIGEEALQNLYAPKQKPSPQAPMPARIGVRAERLAYNPTLAISAEEEKRLQKDIDFERGYGPSFAIPDFGGSTGSLLGEDYDDVTGEIF